jgi:hypothetical protein
VRQESAQRGRKRGEAPLRTVCVWGGGVEPDFPTTWASMESRGVARRLKGRDDRRAPLGSDNGMGRPRRMG